MATTRRIYIIATFICSCAAVALLVTCFATNSWVEATLVVPGNRLQDHEFNHGLFTGHISGRRAQQVSLDLTMSCRMSENKCLMSCHSDEAAREEEWENLLFGNADYSCFGDSTSGTPDKKFINAGVWVSSILFLAIALLAGVLAAVFAVINTTTNPVEPIAGVFGLYIWNGAAAVCTLLVMILWGSLFASVLTDNVAYSETITGDFVSSGLANLGVSYWLLLLVFFLHIGNIVLLVVRKYLLAREPPPPTIKMEDNADGIIFLY